MPPHTPHSTAISSLSWLSRRFWLVFPFLSLKNRFLIFEEPPRVLGNAVTNPHTGEKASKDMCVAACLVQCLQSRRQSCGQWPGSRRSGACGAGAVLCPMLGNQRQGAAHMGRASLLAA